MNEAATTAIRDAWWGDFRRTRPFCDKFGFTRGQPVDRYYIEQFLALHAADIRGRVLEFGDSTYTRRFGGAQVRLADVLQHPPGDRHATFVGDLATGAGLPDEAFDCILMTQTLECLYDGHAALRHVFRSLAEGGVLLLTSGCLGHISRYDADRWGDFWRFTAAGLRELLAPLVAPAEVPVWTYGNAPAATAFLFGLAAHELDPADLEAHDPRFAIVVATRIVKRSAPARGHS